MDMILSLLGRSNPLTNKFIKRTVVPDKYWYNIRQNLQFSNNRHLILNSKGEINILYKHNIFPL